MLHGETLAREFAHHVAACPSGIMACTVRMAVESWFQMELASMLSKSPYAGSVVCGWHYPGTREKADLVARIADRRIVFELKCFVKGADANKLDKWPGQLSRLAKLIGRGDAPKGVAVSTFHGYGNERVAHFIEQFYPAPWNTAGPVNFFDDAPLQLVVATVEGENPGLNG